jgi:hypothetical protein
MWQRPEAGRRVEPPRLTRRAGRWQGQPGHRKILRGGVVPQPGCRPGDVRDSCRRSWVDRNSNDSNRMANRSLAALAQRLISTRRVVDSSRNLARSVKTIVRSQGAWLAVEACERSPIGVQRRQLEFVNRDARMLLILTSRERLRAIAARDARLGLAPHRWPIAPWRRNHNVRPNLGAHAPRCAVSQK